MRKNLVMVMDDIAAIKIAKDTTFALLLEGQRRGYQLRYLNEDQLFLTGSSAQAHMRSLTVQDIAAGWYELGAEETRALGPNDLVMMRADPPVDAGYLYATYLLELAEKSGARVVNKPRALRDWNEKLAIAHFPELIPETLVTSSASRIREFVKQREKAVLKPLDGMGGRGIFLAGASDPNLNVIIETLTANGSQLAMAQQFLPEIVAGDKRVLMVHGQPVPWMLARIPGAQDFRGNLARGASSEGRPIGDAERKIAAAVGPFLVENGIELAGLDVIGDRLTEINVTSPTCIRELDAQFGTNIAGDLFDALEA